MALGNIREANYLIWQQRLATNKLFRYWWQFWSNYAFVFYLLAALCFWREEKLVALVVLAAASFVMARLVVTVLINFFYQKQRPYQRFNFQPITSNFFSLKTNEPNSFPSRHAITFAAVAATVLVFNPLIGFCLLGVTAMTGIARVILGYHWPIDIIAGLILGSIMGYLVAIVGNSLFFT